MKEWLYPDVNIHLQYNLWEDLTCWVDATIVNAKQNQAIKNAITSLLHEYFLFELPENYEECIDVDNFKKECAELRKVMGQYRIKRK